MVFNLLRRSSRSSTSPAPPTLSQSPVSKTISSTDTKGSTRVTTVDLSATTTTPQTKSELQRLDEENRDFELFLQKARMDEEMREKAAKKLAKEMEKRRKNSSMDPWAAKMGKI